MRKCIKWNCNIVDSNSEIIWNSAHLRQKKYCWNKIIFLWWTPKKDLGHTHASGNPEWSHVVGWTTSLRATGKTGISKILLICWSQRDAMVLVGGGARWGKCIHYQTIAAYQASPSMGFSRQEYWSGLSFLSPGDLPDPGIKPGSPALEADALTS